MKKSVSSNSQSNLRDSRNRKDIPYHWKNSIPDRVLAMVPKGNLKFIGQRRGTICYFEEYQKYIDKISGAIENGKYAKNQIKSSEIRSLKENCVIAEKNYMKVENKSRIGTLESKHIFRRRNTEEIPKGISVRKLK